MPIKASQSIWFNGKLVPWEKATVHVLTHALHYGTSVFEGIRAYETHKGVCIFRLREHAHRFLDSARIYRMEMPFSEDEIFEACCTVVAANGLSQGAYLRPIAFRGYGEIGVTPKVDPPTEVAIAALEWGGHLGADKIEKGVDICVSSWQRVAPNTIPPIAKAGGNYLSSQLIGLEARRLGFDEGIGLTTEGLVSEGAGENIFLVKDEQILTPSLAHSILGGLTRDTVIRLARERGLEVREASIPRELLYLADEIFLTGTAIEIMPVHSVDRIVVGAGRRGPVTELLQNDFHGLFRGRTPDKWGWLDPVDMQAKRTAAGG